MLKKKCEVVMLSTTTKAIEGGIMLYPSENQLLIINRRSHGNKLFDVGIEGSPYVNCKLQHLYIISDDEIKKDDWFINITSNTIYKNDIGF